MHLGLPSPHVNQRNSGSLYFIFRASTQALFKQGARGLKKKEGGGHKPPTSPILLRHGHRPRAWVQDRTLSPGSESRGPSGLSQGFGGALAQKGLGWLPASASAVSHPTADQ